MSNRFSSQVSRPKQRLSAALRGHQKFLAAFTLLELLVVIAIIGILAAIGLPAIRGMTKSNAMVAADRQLLDDLAFGRSSAIANHTTVYMVFIPPYITNTAIFPLNGSAQVNNLITNLYTAPFTTYSFVVLRSVGDQPGFGTAHYLTGWRTLPQGIYIAPYKFTNISTMYAPAFTNISSLGSRISFPFPVDTNISVGNFFLPYIAFNYLGQLVAGPSAAPTLTPEYIPLAHGSIFYASDSPANPPFADIAETPPNNVYYTNYASPSVLTNGPLSFGGIIESNVYNQIYIDPLTGRAKVQRLDIQ